MEVLCTVPVIVIGKRHGCCEEVTVVLDNFIVFEGIDGAGTSTQLRLLRERADSDRFWFTAEPTSAPTGTFLRSMLRGDIALDPRTAAYLFAADRAEHVWGKNGIEAQCAHGKLVVSDRYLFSSLAYQSIDCGMELPLMLNASFPLPALLFFFDIAPEAALARVDNRGAREIYEQDDFLHAVRAAYHEVFTRHDNSEMHVVMLDATQSTEHIAAQIAEELRSRYGV